MKLRHLILATIVTLFAACNSSKDSAEDKSIPKTVVTTTNIIANSLKEIVGTDLEVITMMNSETDPHAYTPSPKDYQLLNDSKVIVSNGLHLEGKLHEVINQSSEQNKSNHIMLSDALDKSQLLFEDGVADPHIWFDINQWATCITYTVHELSKIYPEHEEKWNTNLKTFVEKLNKLDTKTKEDIASIPEDTRYLVTAHDAFSYFSRAYNLPVKPLQGRNTTVEASATDAIELSDFIVNHKIQAIFIESTVNRKFIESIQESCQSKGHDVKIGGELFADALGPEGTSQATYTGMLKHNVKTITEALK